MKKNKIGEAFNVGGRGDVLTGFWWGNLREF
jgi:NAD(P)H-hydrate repair Nnr-like enzyme with NAD(P)H-hydrate dehydratase domain